MTVSLTMEHDGLVKNQRDLFILLVALAQLPHHGLYLDLQEINGVGLLGVANDKFRQSPLYLIALRSMTVDMIVQLLEILVDAVNGITETLVHGFVVRLEDSDLVLNLSLMTGLVVEHPLVESVVIVDLELSLQHIVKYKWTKREVPFSPLRRCAEERGQSHSTSDEVLVEGSISQSKQERHP